MKIEQIMQCPKCLKHIEKLAINSFTWMPYCSYCDTKWNIYVNCEDKLKITYEENFDVVELSDCNDFKIINGK